MRFHSLEAFRGLAAIMIVLFHSPFHASKLHSNFISGGYIFVDFFFVLSGFIMAYSYSQSIGKTVFAKTFFLKRFSRIYPLHLFTLLIWIPYLLFKHLLFINNFGGTDPFIINNFSSFIANLLLVQSWGFYSDLTWNAPSWSISTELFAYIFFYFFFYLLHKLPLLNKVLIAITLFIILNIILYIYEYHLGNFTLLINCINSFIGGVLVYFLWLKRPTIQYTLIINTLEVCLLILLIYTVSHLQSIYTDKYLIILLFMSVVYLFSIEEKGIISNILKYKYFQLMGLLSYSIYMTHFLIIDILRGTFHHLLKIPLTQSNKIEILILPYASLLNMGILVLVIVISYFTYYKLEQPIRDRLNHKFN